MRTRLFLVAALCLVATVDAARAAELHLLAAGSLRGVMSEIGSKYRAATGTEVAAAFGPSGLLRRRIENGEHADLFASADMAHPLELLSEGRATRVVMFTRNRLCGIAVPKIGLTTANFVDRLLDPAGRLGTSTPKADPAGDYTWAMFHRIDALHPGSYAILAKKAQQLVGGPTNSAPIGGKNPITAAMAAGRVDLFIAYCSSARLVQSQMRGLQIAEVPRSIAGRPEFGLAILKGADPRTADFALFILSPEGQRIFADYGFAPVALPAPGN
jgi:molybdate transport system substrate-binding protein